METSSLATRPPNTRRTMGNAIEVKPRMSPEEVRLPLPPERLLLSRRTWAAWFSRRRAMLSRLTPSRPRRRPVRVHFSTRRVPSALLLRSEIPSVSVLRENDFDILYSLISYFMPAKVAQRSR